MKVIIFGSTGLVGGAVLHRALAEPAVTSIIAVSRRSLSEDVTKNAKVDNLVIEDFLTYDDDFITRITGFDACIWSIGGRCKDFPDLKAAHFANVDCLNASARMLAEKVSSKLDGEKKFRFVYCSGSFTERDPSKKLYFLEDSRKLKGEAESCLLDIEKEHESKFEVIIARPAGILETNSGFQNMVYGSQGIGKSYLSYAMVDMALHGAANQVTESIALRNWGKKLAEKDTN